MKLSNARAVVSGGASGLGYATAKRIVDAGGHVVLLDVNAEQGEASAAALGDRAKFVQTDVSDEGAVRAAMQVAREFMGGITLAVNCAGVATAGRTLGREGPWPAENFSRVIQINLVGSYNVTKAAFPLMRESGYGRIVTVEDQHPLPGLRLTSVSQEHGEIEGPGTAALRPGTHLRILPNHSCLAAACFSSYQVMHGTEVVDEWRPFRGW